jgi:hypothetical protein
MDKILSLNEISTWRKMLGLFPIPLYGNYGEQRFILLNGAQGNFCLDISSDETQHNPHARNFAWSSNVNHYVSVNKNIVEVQRWDRQAFELERYNTNSITANLEGFHQYLEKSSPKAEQSIIAHSIKLFRRLRAVLGSKFSGEDGLNVFLYFLSCATESKRRHEIDISKWFLSDRAEELANQIREEDWTELQLEFLAGRQIEGLVPDLNLLLRHSAGQLFQEAHFDAILVNPDQLMLAGFLPKPVKLSSPSSSIIGLHFTPPALARTLVEEALRLINFESKRLIIFDPACGSGEFLREAIRQLSIRGYSGEVDIIGWDISEIACAMARYEIGWELRNIKFDVNTRIECKDSLEFTEQWPKAVDLVLMNPPFLSLENMESPLKHKVRKILGTHAGSRPDLSHAFLLLSAQTLSEKGVLGAIIPASFLDSQTSKKMRSFFGEELQTSLVARLGSHQLFPGAQIDPAFYVGTKIKNIEEPIAFWADHRANSNSSGLRMLRRMRYYSNPQTLPIVENGFSIYSYPSQEKELWSPKPYKSWVLLNSLKELGTVDKIFNVLQGIRTGYKKIFILDQETWSKLPDSEKNFFRPAVINDSIKFGYLRLIAYSFFPYGTNMEIATENELRDKLPVYFHSFLLPNKSKLQIRSGIDPQKWWGLTRHRTWLEKRTPKLISTYYGDKGSFAWDGQGEFVVVQGFAWSPKKGLLNEKVSLAYLAILNSNFFSDLIAASSRHVGGGQWDLSKQYIKNIPLPNLFAPYFNNNLLDSLGQIGRNINENDLSFKANYDEYVKQAYGII